MNDFSSYEEWQGPVTSIEHFDFLLLRRYAEYTAELHGQPLALWERQFCTLGLTASPSAVWGLVPYGESAAILQQDTRVLYEALSRFIKCLHASKVEDRRGIFGGGYDFCVLSTPAVYSTLLFGKTYIKSAFSSSRPLSKSSWPACMHVANLMLCMEHPDWPHATKAIGGARRFFASKSGSQTTRAYVGFFLGLVDRNWDVASQSLLRFADGYEKTDWGKYRPGTRGVFMQGMSSYAKLYCQEFDGNGVLSTFLTRDQMDIWGAFYEDRDQGRFSSVAHQFLPPLDFLNDLSHAPRFREVEDIEGPYAPAPQPKLPELTSQKSAVSGGFFRRLFRVK